MRKRPPAPLSRVRKSRSCCGGPARSFGSVTAWSSFARCVSRRRGTTEPGIFSRATLIEAGQPVADGVTLVRMQRAGTPHRVLIVDLVARPVRRLEKLPFRGVESNLQRLNGDVEVRRL